jgi:hypothetical protein
MRLQRHAFGAGDHRALSPRQGNEADIASSELTPVCALLRVIEWPE